MKYYLMFCLFLIACNNGRIASSPVQSSVSESSKKDSTYSMLLLRRGDSLSHKIPKQSVYVFVRAKGKIHKVEGNNWPDSIETTFNLIRQNNKPIAYVEVPFSESGDWSNTYTYYFDTDETTRAIKIRSSFFNSECVPGALTEETILLFDNKFRQLSKQHHIYDENGNEPVDTSKCVFNYRFEYNSYKSFSSTPLFH